jgi:hypothetical protein
MTEPAQTALDAIKRSILNETRNLSSEDFIAVMDEVADDAQTRADAAKEDLARGLRDKGEGEE